MAFRIGVLLLSTTPMSIRVYVARLGPRLERMGLTLVEFADPHELPAADLYWDPRTGGGRAPTPALLDSGRPVVVTLHDMAHVSLPWREFYPGPLTALSGRWHCLGVARDWQGALPRLARIIVPSFFTRDEAVDILALDPALISVIPHGVEHGDFTPRDPGVTGGSPYLLHISQYQPRKNVARLLAAYSTLPEAERPRLVVKLIDYSGPRSMPGVEFIDGVLSEAEIADLYSGALAFVFPSLNEGFGLPVLEAMACGCPVITSRGTACAEVAGDAALLVDPRSVPDIARAMTVLAGDPTRRSDLRERGLTRAATFNWDVAAERHAQVFREALAG